MDLKKNMPYIVILLVAVGICTFAGFKFLKGSKSNTAAQMANSSAQDQPGSGFGSGNGNSAQGGRSGRNGQGRGNFQPVHGTIASIDGQIIKMTADDNSTKNITTSSTTRITRMDSGQRVTLTLSDLKVGDEINVMNSGTDTTNIAARMIIVGQFTMPQNGGGGQWRGQGQGESSGGQSSGVSDQSTSAI